MVGGRGGEAGGEGEEYMVGDEDEEEDEEDEEEEEEDEEEEEGMRGIEEDGHAVPVHQQVAAEGVAAVGGFQNAMRAVVGEYVGMGQGQGAQQQQQQQQQQQVAVRHTVTVHPPVDVAAHIQQQQEGVGAVEAASQPVEQALEQHLEGVVPAVDVSVRPTPAAAPAGDPSEPRSGEGEVVSGAGGSGFAVAVAEAAASDQGGEEGSGSLQEQVMEAAGHREGNEQLPAVGETGLPTAAEGGGQDAGGGGGEIVAAGAEGYPALPSSLPAGADAAGGSGESEFQGMEMQHTAAAPAGMPTPAAAAVGAAAVAGSAAEGGGGGLQEAHAQMELHHEQLPGDVGDGMQAKESAAVGMQVDLQQGEAEYVGAGGAGGHPAGPME